VLASKIFECKVEEEPFTAIVKDGQDIYLIVEAHRIPKLSPEN
jgi:hypothetical protein